LVGTVIKSAGSSERVKTGTSASKSPKLLSGSKSVHLRATIVWARHGSFPTFPSKRAGLAYAVNVTTKNIIHAVNTSFRARKESGHGAGPTFES